MKRFQNGRVQACYPIWSQFLTSGSVRTIDFPLADDGASVHHKLELQEFLVCIFRTLATDKQFVCLHKRFEKMAREVLISGGAQVGNEFIVTGEKKKAPAKELDEFPKACLGGMIGHRVERSCQIDGYYDDWL